MIAPIDAKHLRKAFGDTVAVADLTLAVGRGEVFGFLGPNGAGKTTAVKMLLGLIHPTAGEGALFGRPLGDPRGRARVGFLPEHFSFPPWLKATEFLQLHADLYRMPRALARRRIPALLERVGLNEHAGRRLRTYSKGMLQRVGLAQALLNEPDLVLLDEPTSGLDPLGRRLVRDIIHELRERGTTVFLNSHLLSEVEITCDRVAVIHHGEVIRVTSLRAAGGSDALDGGLSVEVRARAPEGDWTAIAAGLRRWSEHVRVNGERVSLTVSGEADLPAIARYLVESGADVYELTPSRLSLEDLFVQLVEEGEDR